MMERKELREVIGQDASVVPGGAHMFVGSFGCGIQGGEANGGFFENVAAAEFDLVGIGVVFHLAADERADRDADPHERLEQSAREPDAETGERNH